jgi:hypothetical protein
MSEHIPARASARFSGVMTTATLTALGACSSDSPGLKELSESAAAAISASWESVSRTASSEGSSPPLRGW